VSFEDQLETLRDEAQREYAKLEEELEALEFEIEKGIVKLYNSIFGEVEDDTYNDL